MWKKKNSHSLRSFDLTSLLERPGEVGTKKPANYSHRTATTIRPCCIPALGDSIGAGRIRLAGVQMYTNSEFKVNVLFKKYF